MSNITASTNIDQVKEDEQIRFVDLALQDIVRVVNGNLDFPTNFNWRNIISVDFTAQDTEVTINHGLGRSPKGYIITGTDTATSIYDGDTPADETAIYLKATQIATVRLVVF